MLWDSLHKVYIQTSYKSSWNITIFDANTPYHAMTLTFDPLTLNIYVRSVLMRSTYVPKLGEIDQSAAELLMINNWFFVRF